MGWPAEHCSQSRERHWPPAQRGVVCTGSLHRLRAPPASRLAHLRKSLDFPATPSRRYVLPSPEVPTAQYPQEASQADRLIPSWNKSARVACHQGSSLHTHTEGPYSFAEALRAMATEVFLLLLLSTLLILSSPSPPKKTSFQVCSLLTRTVKWLPSLLPRRLRVDGGPGWTIPINPSWPCPSQSHPQTELAAGDSETNQLGPSEHLEHACHISSGHRPTPLGAGRGHWEVNYLPQIEQEATGAALQ